MNNRLKISIIVGLALLLMLLCFFMQKQRMFDAVKEKLDILQFENGQMVAEVEKERNEKGQLIVKATSIVFENEQLEEQLKDERLKKLRTKVEFQTETIYDTILMNIHDTIVIENGIEIKKRTFVHKTEWISLKGEVHDSIVNIKEIIIHDSLDVQVGLEKDGLFKKKNVVVIKSKNPNSDLKDIKPYEFKEKKKWYQRDGWKFVTGGVVALIIVLQTT
jgi:predicted nuclease with TOPRIM domain